MKHLTSLQYCGNVGLRWFGKPVSRHGGSGALGCKKAVQIIVQLLFIDFSVVAPVERRDPFLDREPQPVELQRLNGATLLQGRRLLWFLGVGGTRPVTGEQLSPAAQLVQPVALFLY